MQIKLSKVLEGLALDGRIAVALSGGADSMALALLSSAVFKERIVTLTVDHKLRPESTKEAKVVGKWMKERGIEHHILTWEGNKPKKNIESLARSARYRLLLNWCEENAIKILLIAHNMEDQAETFLLRLARGSGLYGLSGMEKESFSSGIRIIRPLLEVSKEELKEYLRNEKQKWVEDPHNDSTVFERVKVRKFLPRLQEIGITPRIIAETSFRLQQDKKILKDIAHKLFKKYLKFDRRGFALIGKGIFQEEKTLFIHVISELFLVLGNPYPPVYEQMERFYTEKGRKTSTLGGLLFYAGKEDILVNYEYETIKDMVVKGKSGQTVDFLKFKIRADFDFQVKPLGTVTNKQIKDSGIPALIRRSLPIIHDAKGMVFFPFLEKMVDFKVDYTPSI